MNAFTVIIRPVRLKDAQQVRDNCFSANTFEQVKKGIRHSQYAAAKGKEIQLVAEVEGTVVGIVSLVRKMHPLNNHRAEVGGLVVEPNYQGRGIARRLVSACQEKAQQMGILILEISCRAGEPAEQIYPRLGFIEYGHLPCGIVEPWGEYKKYDQIYFYKPID